MPFFAALAEHRDSYDLALYVSLTRSPEEVAAAIPASRSSTPGLTGVCWGGRAARDFRALRNSAESHALLFEALDAVAGPPGHARRAAPASRRVAGTCARSARSLLVVGTPPRPRRCAASRRGGACAYALSEDRLRIAKAEARGPGCRGQRVPRRASRTGARRSRPLRRRRASAPRCGPCARSATSASPISHGCSASPPARSRRPSAAAGASRSRRSSTRARSSTSRSTSCCAATSTPATASPAATTRAGVPTAGRWRCSPVSRRRPTVRGPDLKAALNAAGPGRAPLLLGELVADRLQPHRRPAEPVEAVELVAHPLRAPAHREQVEPGVERERVVGEDHVEELRRAAQQGSSHDRSSRRIAAKREISGPPRLRARRARPRRGPRS